MAPRKKFASVHPGCTRFVSELQFDGKILNGNFFLPNFADFRILCVKIPHSAYFNIIFVSFFFSCDQWILPSRRDSSCQTKRSIWTFISSQIYKFSNQLSFKTSTKFYILWRYYYYYHHGGIFALRKFPSLNLLFF